LWLPLLSFLEVFLAHISDSSIIVQYLTFKLLHIVFIIEFTIELHELVSHGEEHHAPCLDWVVIVLLDDAPGDFEVVVLAAEEIEIGFQVIVLYAKCAHRLFGLLNFAEKVNCFMHSVLQLQVVNED